MSGGLNRLSAIRLVAFDIDGVFTDGRFYLSDEGSETKAFHTQDGYGVRRLIDAGVEVGIDAADCAFVGDDIPDLALLEHVGLSIAVANAVQAVQECCDYVTRKPGGFGAVREVCDLVAASRSDRPE